MRWAILASFLICATAHAADYFVDAKYQGPPGAHNTYATLAAAVAAAPSGLSPEHPTRIFIRPGTYKQQLTISQSNLDLIGTGGSAADIIITDDLNARTPRPGGGTYGTTGASSTFITGNHLTVLGVTFQNSTAYGGSQAVALKTSGDEIAFEDCRFASFQDTLYVTNGRDDFEHCQVSGSVDFIFGDATALFDHCTITSRNQGAVTAANTRPDTAVGFVFLDCTLEKAADLGDHRVILGRPWQFERTDANVVFIRCKMGRQIKPEGWGDWNATNLHPGGDSRYAEYDSMTLDGKPLDVSQRVPWSHQLTAEEAARYTAAHIFGPADYWRQDDRSAVWGPRNHPAARQVDWKLGGAWNPARQLAAALAAAARPR
jgi:pectinesterase